MKTSNEGLRLITQREGKILHVYKDSRGFPTAGVGHLLGGLERRQFPVGTPITLQQCQDWLKEDVVKCEDAINGLNVKLSQNEFDALVSLAFNIGVGGFNKSTVVRRLRNGDHRGAAEAILLWNKPPEIRGRRRGEYHQFLTSYSAAIADVPSIASAREDAETPAPDPQLPPDTTPTDIAAEPTPSEDPGVLSQLKEKANTVGDQIQEVNSTVDKFSFPSMPTGLGTRLIVIGMKAWATILMIGGVLYNHRDFLYIAVILALGGAFMWNASRNRNNPPGAGVTQTTTKKWWHFWG